jgi:hypothetical protein
LENSSRIKEMIRKERSAKDSLIDELLADPSVKVLRNGTIWAKRTRSPSPGRLIDDDGFVESTISNGGRKSFFYRKSMLSVPRIIYRAFIGELDSSKEITHKDGDSSNNASDNLELLSESMGAGHALRRFSSAQIMDIRTRRSQGERLDAIAEDYDTSAIVVSKICRGQTYKDSGGPITKMGELGPLRGPDNPRTKLNHVDYDKLLRKRNEGATLASLAQEFNLSKSGVSKICSKERIREAACSN